MIGKRSEVVQRRFVVVSVDFWVSLLLCVCLVLCLGLKQSICAVTMVLVGVVHVVHALYTFVKFFERNDSGCEVVGLVDVDWAFVALF